MNGTLTQMLISGQTRRRGLALLLVCTLGAFGIGNVAAQDEPAENLDTPKVDVSTYDSRIDQFSGDYTSRYPFAVPAFRRLEPGLGLSYRSSGGNGVAGVGWSVQGDSRIERASPGRGVPNWTSSDIYLLDGMELVPCKTGSVSPSCTSGGSHSTKIENYTKIKFLGENAGWQIWSQDGTRSDYTGRFNAANGKAWHWLRSKVVDTRGNTVDYSYWIGTWAYLWDINYNGTLVAFRYEMRPTSDYIYLANGSNQRALIDRRLVSVDVRVSGARLRAYQLLYGASVSIATQRSRLQSVRQFGNDAGFDTGAHVTGGTALPAHTFTYSDHAQGAFTQGIYAGLPVGGTGSFSGENWFESGLGDFDGDGLTDVIMYQTIFTPNQLVTGLKCDVEGSRSLKATVVFLTNPDGSDRRVSESMSSYDTDNNALNWVRKYLDCSDSYPRRAGDRIGVSFADFNGDGKTDYIVRISSEPWILVGLSNGDGTFTRSKYVSPTAGLLTAVGAESLVGDFNGDGCADIALRQTKVNSGWTDTPMYLSNCQGGFTLSRPSNPMSTLIHDKNVKVMLGDFNGDGKTDIAMRKVSWGSVPVMFADGAGNFRTTNVVLAGGVNMINEHMTNRRSMLGDFNGDGKMDIAVRNIDAASTWASIPIYFSNGDGSFTVTNTITGGNNKINGGGLMTRNSVPDLPQIQELVGDFNGDGRTDIALHDARGNHNWGVNLPVYYSRGDGSFAFAELAISSSPLNQWQTKAYVGDFNGDGRQDILGRYVGGSGWKERKLTFAAGSPSQQIKLADLIVTDNNGFGGSSSMNYKPSSGWVNSNNPPLRQTLQQLVVKDGRAAASDRTDTFSFSGGLWDRVDRRFLGFRTGARITCNSGEVDCQTEQTWFKQDYGSVSKVERSQISAGPSKLLKVQENTYTNNGATVPYTSLLSAQMNYDYDGTSGSACPGANCKRRRMGFTYNAYGNTTRAVDEGDVDVAGDEVNRATAYVPNVSAYIVGLPAAETVYTGTGSSGPLQQLLYEYDRPGSSGINWNVAPSKGDRTKVARWLANPNSYVMRSFTFDAWGNPLTDTDEVGNLWRRTFDSTYHLFPISATDPLGRITTTVWDAMCGAPTLVRGLNGASDQSTFSYDALCREIRMDTPLGGFKITKYQAFGTMSSQNTRIETPSADGNGNQWTESYFDGQGRIWRTRGKGPGGQLITSDFEFTRRGQSARTSQPYYAGTPKWETFKYDALDRVLEILRPDGRKVSNSYAPRRSTSINERGDAKELYFDARDNLITERFRTCGSCGWLQNTHKYDLVDRRIESNDAEGNRWTYSFDSLSRLSSDRDPDRGSWSYTYFADGKLATQRDAKSQTTTYTYDQFGRKRSANVGSITRTWSYDQARSGYFNIGRLTSISDSSGGATYDYDLAGRQVKMVKTISGTNYAFSHGYDAGGRLKWTTYPNGSTVGTATTPLTYDGAGRSLAIPGVVNSATYTANGALATLAYANGSSSSFSYDGVERLSRILAVKGATTLLDLSYGRDASGAITSVTGPKPFETWTYTYDGLSRLTSATPANVPSGNSENFTYSPSGRMLFSSRWGSGSAGTYAYPAQGASSVRPHAPTAIGLAIYYSYDANGNRMSGGGSHVWDAANRLSQLGATTFAYDADDRRVSKSGAQGTVHYPRGDYRVNAGVVSQHISFANMTVATRTGSTLRWLHNDHQGSPRVLTDSSGLEVQRFARRPYGQRVVVGTNVEEELDFTGARLDAETGLNYFDGKRYYDNSAQVFVSPDQLDVTKPAVGFARYAFSLNNPVNYIDDGNEVVNLGTTNFDDVLAAAALAQDAGQRVTVSFAGILNSTGSNNLGQFMDTVNSANPQGFNIVIPNEGFAVVSIFRALNSIANPQQVQDGTRVITALATQGTYFDIAAHSNGNAATGVIAPLLDPSVSSHINSFSLVSPNIDSDGARGIFSLGRPTNVDRNPGDDALLGSSLFGVNPNLDAQSLADIAREYANVSIIFNEPNGRPNAHEFFVNFRGFRDGGTAGFGGVNGGRFGFGPPVSYNAFTTFDSYGGGYENRFDFDFGGDF